MFVNYISKILVLIGFASNDDGYMVISKYNYKKKELRYITIHYFNQISFLIMFRSHFHFR